MISKHICVGGMSLKEFFVIFFFQFSIKAGGAGGVRRHVLLRVWYHRSPLSALQNGLCALPHQPVQSRCHQPETHVSYSVELWCFLCWSSWKLQLLPAVFFTCPYIQFLFLFQEWESRVQADCGEIREESCLSEASSSFLPCPSLSTHHKN